MPPLPNSLLKALPNNQIAEDIIRQLNSGQFTSVNHRVYSTVIDGERMFLKFYENNKCSKELKIRFGLFEHEALAEYQAFISIKKLGIATITPIAAFSYKQGKYQKSLIISKDFHQSHQLFKSLKQTISDNPEQCATLLKQLSATVVHLLKNNIFYLDIHLDNFLTDGSQLAVMDAEGTFHCPDRKQTLIAKFLDMSARNLLQDLNELKQDTTLLQDYFQPIITELGLTQSMVYQLLWKRQTTKRLDMYIRLLKGRASIAEVRNYHYPLPHLQLFSQEQHG